jgi:lipoyl(octanoyl) transferase
VASMEAELDRTVDVEEVKAKILVHFKTLFEIDQFIAS